MKVAIAGGKLQGVEASFLARCLGWKVMLIDRDPNVPARGLCNSFYQCDIARDHSTLREIMKKADFVVPAVENVAALKSLGRSAASMGIPFAYDEKTYFISRSKNRSNRFFQSLDIPVPKPWPQSGFPVVVKPSNLSGSEGVEKICTEEELSTFSDRIKGGQKRWVVQEYLEGPSYSLEVFGFEDRYETLQVTDLEMDDRYDCRRVIAPSIIPKPLETEIKKIACRIAKELHLIGVMDVEVIDHRGTLKVLEIDARLPSQTPTVVLKSTGINMMELLAKVFVQRVLPILSNVVELRGTIYEHIRVSREGIEFLGEHMMAESGPLKEITRFFGADMALTNFEEKKLPWVATLIVTGEDRKDAWLKRNQVIENILEYLEGMASPKSGKEQIHSPG